MNAEENALDLLRAHKKFVLTSHMSPDGDGVGSQLALGRALKGLGCDVTIINPSPVPWNLRFLLAYPKEITTPADWPSPARHFQGALTVVLDIGDFDRLGAVRPFLSAGDGILVVDHHRLERVDGVHFLVDTSACATGHVTARLLEKLGVPLSPEIAEPLYVALHTDTGGFRYPGTSPELHRLVAKLLEAGADPQKIYTEIYERLSEGRLRLMGEVLSTTTVSPGGKIAWIVLRQSMLGKAGARMEEADDLVNFTLQIDGVVAGFYFKELDNGRTKVSCRSRGDFAIDRFVSPWGGGGHRNAAGVRLDMPVDEAIGLLTSKLAALLEPGE